MKKHQIKIPVLLPEVPDEKDKCVDRLIRELENVEGLEKIHVSRVEQKDVPRLCFHYNPEMISVDRIQSMARQAGSKLCEHFGHKLIEVKGIRHTRHARHIERDLNNTDGILEASVSASGMVRVEYEMAKLDETSILNILKKEGLTVPDPKVSAERFLKEQNVSNGEHGDSHSDGHDHDHAHHHGHDHSHGGIFGHNSELIFSLIGGGFLAIGFGLSFVDSISSWTSLGFYLGAYLFGGYYTTKEAIETVSKGGFEIDFLMLVAAIGAAILGEWAEGAFLLFLFSLGHALEHYAMNRARKSISALTDLAPKKALLKTGDGLEEVDLDQLQVGDVIVVRPNSKIPADGVVVDGYSSVNQAPITGESIPVEKVPYQNPNQKWSRLEDIPSSNRVYSGTINGNSTLEIHVIRKNRDSTLSRLINLVHEAQTQKSPTQRFTDRFERYFVPAVLILVVVLNFAFLVINETYAESFYRSMAVLVAASPCALAISTPSAVLSGVARAAQGGVLIKGGRPLEDLGVLTALAFDKTGTLTVGEPRMTGVIPFKETSERELLEIAIAVENLSDHPLAKAVVRDGTGRIGGPGLLQAHSLISVPGKGVKARIGDDEILIGNLDLFDEGDENAPKDDVLERISSLEAEGNTTMLIRKNAQYIGILALKDTPREDAQKTISRLKEIGLQRIFMLSGDNQVVADAIAKEVGLTEAWGNLLPDEKVAAVQKLRKTEDKIAMVGDGVNDAPAMAHSTVGIAMGAAGSDVALETADVALLGDRLEALPFAIGLSRKVKNIIRQNLWVSLGIVALLIPATILDLANIGIAVLIHEGSTLLVVSNALRLLRYKG